MSVSRCGGRKCCFSWNGPAHVYGMRRTTTPPPPHPDHHHHHHHHPRLSPDGLPYGPANKQHLLVVRASLRTLLWQPSFIKLRGFRSALVAEHDFSKSNILSVPPKRDSRALIRLFLIHLPGVSYPWAYMLYYCNAVPQVFAFPRATRMRQGR